MGANYTHTHTHTWYSCIYLVKLALCASVNKVCVLTTNGAPVSHILYNMCESVAVSSGTPGVFAFPLWMKIHMYSTSILELYVISSGKVKSTSTVPRPLHCLVQSIMWMYAGKEMCVGNNHIKISVTSGQFISSWSHFQSCFMSKLGSLLY